MRPEEIENQVLYRFGPFCLDPIERRLLRGNEVIALSPKAFEALLILVENSGHVVHKDKFHQRLWPNTFVDDGSLTVLISRLRKALGEGDSDDAYIQTVTKLGYRFIAEVEQGRAHPNADENFVCREAIKQRDEPPLLQECEEIADGSSSLVQSPITRIWLPRLTPTKALIVAMLVFGSLVGLYFFFELRNKYGTTTVTGRRILAVLPFKSMSGESDHEYLGLGMADALIARLSNVRQIIVRPTSTMRKFAGREEDAIIVGRELGADFVLEGSIQRVGDTVRVTAQLISVGDGATLWARTFDEQFTSVFAVQDVIAERVSASLKVEITSNERARLYRRYTEKIAAYEYYLRGRVYLTRHTRESTLAAIEMFENALRLDPNYALAHAGVAIASAEMYLRYATDAEVKHWGERSELELAQALEKDPDLAETHQALAAIYRKKEFNWDRVIQESDRALALNPNLEQPYFYRAAAFYHLGLLEMASRELSKGTEVNSQERVEPVRTAGVIALYSGKFAEAISFLEEVRRLSSAPLSDPHLGMAYYYQGDAARAEALLEELSNHPSASASTRAQSALASILAARGERAKAQGLLRTIVTRNYMDHHVAYSVGAAYAQIGNREEALAWLRDAVRTGLPCYQWYEQDPLLQPLRGDPEFKILLTELRELWQRAKNRYGA